MKLAKILGVIVMASSISACSCMKKGKGGMGEGGMEGAGNIPGAEAGGPLTDINFAFDSSSVSEASKGILRDNAKWLMDNASAKVTVEGHCDERGTDEYNMALGERRARSSADYLRSLGIAADRMSTVSYGESMPLDTGHTEAAWGKNRRAHFRVN